MKISKASDELPLHGNKGEILVEMMANLEFESSQFEDELECKEDSEDDEVIATLMSSRKRMRSEERQIVKSPPSSKQAASVVENQEREV